MPTGYSMAYSRNGTSGVGGVAYGSFAESDIAEIKNNEIYLHLLTDDVY